MAATRWVLSQRLLYHDQTTPYAFQEYELISPSGKILTGKTDDQGYVRYEVDEVGEYQLRLLQDEMPDVLEVEEDSEEEDSEDAGEEVLCATIMDESGRNPVANTAVELPELDETLFTDGQGYFETMNVEMGEYEIVVQGKRITVPTHDEPEPSYRVRLPKG